MNPPEFTPAEQEHLDAFCRVVSSMLLILKERAEQGISKDTPSAAPAISEEAHESK